MSNDPDEPLEPFVTFVGVEPSPSPADVQLAMRAFEHANKHPPTDWHAALWWSKDFPDAFYAALRELAELDKDKPA